jgi:hypothetical protein
MESKKITTEELKTILNQQKEITKVLCDLGILESQKHSLLHDIADKNKAVEEFKSLLFEKYGDININLEDGSYTDVEKKEPKLEVVDFEEVK